MMHYKGKKTKATYSTIWRQKNRSTDI